MEKIRWVLNEMPKSEDKYLPLMETERIREVKAFHESFPQYTVTPLAKLDGMAKRLGLGGLFVKDESWRFGLNAFKVLGGSFAMARYIAGETGKSIADMTYEYMTGEQLLKDFGQATLNDILRRYVTPYGVALSGAASLPAVRGFSVVFPICIFRLLF